MGRSILARTDRLSLGNGMCLRLLSAYELLSARREARKMTRSRAEQPLCSNACLIARALEAEGEEKPFFTDGEQVLLALTAEEIENLAACWDRFRRESVPVVEENVERGVNENFSLPPCGGGGPRSGSEGVNSMAQSPPSVGCADSSHARGEPSEAQAR